MARKDEYADMKEGEKVQTVFSENTTFKGTLRFDTSIKIEGNFRGKILSEGFLIIGENAKVRANIKAGSIVSAGEVRGDVDAKERLEMLPSGKRYGNIRTKKLKMADGVVFEGSCEMLSGSGDARADVRQGASTGTESSTGSGVPA
jgi:cytoskeletal protein CcmA (bactofilin family)